MNNDKLHELLPIGNNERILKTIRHHWFAYVSVYVGAGFLCLLILAGLVALILSQDSLGFNSGAISGIIMAGVVLMVLIGAFSFIPVWIKKQEMLVLTEEALLQVKKPSLFANKVSQLNLQHIADVTVHQDTIGALFGFGSITVETPGEQANYEFSVIKNPREAAKEIIEAHENYAAALESGRLHTTLGAREPVVGSAWREAAPLPPASSNSSADLTVGSQADEPVVNTPRTPLSDDQSVDDPSQLSDS